jgi:hypothetical protein
VGTPVNTDRDWTQAVRWTEVVVTGASITMSADAELRVRLAADLDVESIGALSADLTLRPWLDGIEAKGVLRARVIRICGVSLEPFEEIVDDSFVLRFVPEGSANAAPPPQGDVELDLEADDPPDSVTGDAVDLGYYLGEQLALALSPFPRKPGVEFAPQATSGSISPFAVLAGLKSPSAEKSD